MEEAEENPNWFDKLVPDLVEEIFLRLPAKSILKSRSVSKQWRSILDSKLFVETRKNLEKSRRRRILAAYDCDCGRRPSLLPESRFEGDEEIVYLHCDAEQRPSITFDGLLCFLEPYWINVFNPSTRQLRRFPSAINPKRFFSPLTFAMGFGKDEVTGSYRVVMMCFTVSVQCGVLDVETGEWRKLNPPPYYVNDVRSKSVCVNGLIYWLHYIWRSYKLLALDLHNEEFHDVASVPFDWITQETEISNLEDRLAISKTKQVGAEWILEIMSMDANEESWSKIYSIRLTVVSPKTRFRPLAVSKGGNLVFYDNRMRLFKYYPGSNDEVRCLSTDIHVMSLHLENLVQLPINSSNTHTDPAPSNSTSRCRLHIPAPSSWIFSKFLQLMNALRSCW